MALPTTEDKNLNVGTRRGADAGTTSETREVACDGYAGGFRTVACGSPCVAALYGARNIKNWWAMVGSPSQTVIGEHKWFSKPEKGLDMAMMLGLSNFSAENAEDADMGCAHIYRLR